jgi:hypothetical protein
MPTHPALTRQQARVAAAAETAALPAPAFYQQNAAYSGTSAYGPSRKSLIIHVEAAAGANAGVNQIATQDPDVVTACADAVKEGILSKIGSLI